MEFYKNRTLKVFLFSVCLYNNAMMIMKVDSVVGHKPAFKLFHDCHLVYTFKGRGCKKSKMLWAYQVQNKS